MAKSTKLTREDLDQILFPQGRYTQDSPVYTDVWLTYADLANQKRPNDRVDLLLNPHRNSSPGDLCRWVCERLECDAEIDRRKGITTKRPQEGFGIAVNESHVVLRLSLGELVRVALPLTNWWLSYLWQKRNAARTRGGEMDPYARASDQIKEFAQSATRDLVAVALGDFIHRALGNEPATNPTPSGHHEVLQLPEDLLWMIWIVGRISLAAGRKAEPTAKRLVAEVYKLVEKMDTTTVPPEPILWSVSRNRPVELSTSKSVSTMKADAAKRVFDVSCDRLTWAVLDSGIDATHPAFAKPQEPNRPDAQRASSANPEAASEADAIHPAFAESAAKGDPNATRPFRITNRGRLANNTRVLATYDFTRLRDLVSIKISDDPERANTVTAVDRARVQEMQTGLRNGRMIDWHALERELKVDYNPDNETHQPVTGTTYDQWLQTWYRTPKNEHGTHVAGILGGDWRERKLQGVCPDINLYDLRVLDDNGRGDEYSVLAALQFIRYLNGGKDQPAIHGANISMSIRHDVVNYACGRTPVCEESARLVASGVVVVAAAGNQGFAKYLVAGQELPLEGYRSISITDPGNTEAVITVGATHRQHPHTYGVSYFSSRGPTGDGRSKPDLVAPGEKITAPIPGNKSKSLDGTSMAAPHVSGAAALLMARYPEFKGEPQRIKEILCETATDLGRERYFQGHGMIDVLRALQSV